jgi:hypothetical protein
MRTCKIGFLFAGVCAVLLSSCCTQVECEPEISEIQLVNFELSEVDSIGFTSYQKSSNFTLKVDSMLMKGTLRNPLRNEIFISLSKVIDINLDYKIEIFKTRDVFLLNNFKTKRASCNDCFLIFPVDFFNVVESYDINGINQSGNNIVLIKQ